MASGRRAQELAEMLLKLNDKLPAQQFGCGGCAASRAKFSGVNMDWLRSFYARNPKTIMYGGAVVAIAAVAGVGYMIYKKNQKK